MRCARAQYLYDEYVAGTLDHRMAESVDVHLTECPECRDYFETNDDLAELIFEGNEVVHPGEPYLNHLSERVLDAVEKEASGSFDTAGIGARGPGHAWRRPLWWVGIAATVALVVLGIQRDPSVNLPREIAALNRLDDLSFSPVPPERDFSELFDPGFVVQPRRGGIESVSSRPSASGGAMTRAAGQTVVKSVTHPEPHAEADPREQALAMLGNAPTPGMTPVRVERPPDPARTEEEPGTALVEQIIVLDAIGTPEARERIYALLESVGRSPETGMGELLQSGDPALLKQWSVFRQAESAWRENRLEVALKTFILAAEMDPESVLGLRAHLRIADLRYQGWADFERAHESYARCTGPRAAQAFTRQEVAHIERRANLLGRYAAVGWEPLKIMHVVSHNPWPDAALALANLARGTEAPLLMPEAAQVVIARLQAPELPSDADAQMMLNGLSESARAMENRASQAWLALCMGEIYLTVFRNAEAALNACQGVVELDPQSPAADHARRRQYEIRTQALRPGSR